MGYIAVSRERLLAYLGQLAQTHKELIVLQRAINDIDYQYPKLAVEKRIDKPSSENPNNESRAWKIIGKVISLIFLWGFWTLFLSFFVAILLVVFYLLSDLRLPILSDHPFWRFCVTALLIAGILAIPIAWLNESSSEDREKAEWEKYEKDLIEDQVRVSKEKILQTQMMTARQQLAQQYTRTNTILHQLYEVKVNGEYLLFPKYRNMVAIVMLLEYLESRRCSTLTGHEGAYNIYENEIRLNRIITQLNDVINRLDEIKDNQYYLYDLISDANRKNNQIHQELLNGMAQISQNTALAATYSEVTANNTSAMRMIEEYRFLTRR